MSRHVSVNKDMSNMLPKKNTVSLDKASFMYSFSIVNLILLVPLSLLLQKAN
jgi:hypothetical protein